MLLFTAAIRYAIYCHLNLNSARYLDVMFHRFNDGSMYFHHPQIVGPPPCSKTRTLKKNISRIIFSGLNQDIFDAHVQKDL